MKILEKQTNEKRTIELIDFENKKFKRIVKLSGKEVHNSIDMKFYSVEWRRAKTNNQVPRDNQEYLEDKYNSIYNSIKPTTSFKGYSTVDLMASGSTQIHSFVNKSEDDFMRNLEKGLVDFSEGGKRLLAGVKYVKETTGWGLKDSKDFVEAFFERKRVWDKHL